MIKKNHKFNVGDTIKVSGMFAWMNGVKEGETFKVRAVPGTPAYDKEVGKTIRVSAEDGLLVDDGAYGGRGTWYSAESCTLVSPAKKAKKPIKKPASKAKTKKK